MILALLNVYINKDSQIIIIPNIINKYGFGEEAHKYIKIDKMESYSELGFKIREAINISQSNEANTSGKRTFIEASGLKSWGIFQKKYKAVTVTLLEDNSIKIAGWLQKKDGSYGLDSNDDLQKYIIKKETCITDEELGRLVVEMYERM
jgi:hypothetical protein